MVKKQETAPRVKQRCNALMEWCMAPQFISGNSVGVTGKLLPRQIDPGTRVVHHSAMPWPNVPSFVSPSLQSKSPSLSKRMLEFLILTAARPGEGRGRYDLGPGKVRDGIRLEKNIVPIKEN